MNDSRLLIMAQTNGFVVPPRRCYLGDAGFGVRPGIAISFSLIRCHLSDWVDAENRPTKATEYYNLRHSQARVKVENAFGWLKRTAKLIRQSAPEYPLEKQIQFLYACIALYNFQRSQPTEEPTDDELVYLQHAKTRADDLLGRPEMEDPALLRRTVARKRFCRTQVAAR